MTVLGAGIVLLTFVVKDVYRDSEKDLVEDISQAESQYQSSSATNETLFQLDTIESGIGRLEKKEIQHELTLDDLESLKMANLGYLENNRKNLETIRKLADALPTEGIPEGLSVERRVIELYYQIAIERNRNEELWNDKTHTKVWIAEQYGHYWVDIYKITIKVSKLQQKVLARAEIELAVRQSEVKDLTNVGYVLYPLGWALGLVGKLFGKEEDDDKEES